LDSYTTADMNTGAIYRALPVYRVTSPDRPVTPVLRLPKLNTTTAGASQSDCKLQTSRLTRASVAHWLL